MQKRFLITPGPTPVPPEVLSALSEPVVHHRAPRFTEILKQVVAGMKYIYKTENDIIVFSGSGTGAMESAVVNVVNPATTCWSARSGNFGERWKKLATTWGAEVTLSELRVGHQGRARRHREGARRRPRHQGRLRAVQRDVHRRRQRHQGDRRDRRQDAGDPRGRRHQRPRRHRPARPTSGTSTSASPAPRRRSWCLPVWPMWRSARRRGRSSSSATTPRFYYDYVTARKKMTGDSAQTPYTPAVSLMVAQNARHRPHQGGGPRERVRASSRPRAAPPRRASRRSASSSSAPTIRRRTP